MKNSARSEVLIRPVLLDVDENEFLVPSKRALGPLTPVALSSLSSDERKTQQPRSQVSRRSLDRAIRAHRAFVTEHHPLLKYIFVLVNSFGLFIGLVFAGAGIWCLASKTLLEIFLPYIVHLTFSSVLASTGLFMVVASHIGFWSVLKQRKWGMLVANVSIKLQLLGVCLMLNNSMKLWRNPDLNVMSLYNLTLLIFLKGLLTLLFFNFKHAAFVSFMSVVMFISAILEGAYEESVVSKNSEQMYKSLEKYSSSKQVKRTWNTMQSNLECCGVAYFKDWCSLKKNHSAVPTTVNTSLMEIDVNCIYPSSCHAPQKEHRKVPEMNCTAASDLMTLYKDGCIGRVRTIVQLVGYIYRSTAISNSVFMLIDMCFSLVLFAIM